MKNLYGLSNQLVHCTLPIITIAVVGTSPLLNALFLWEIMYSIETMHKHAHNEWQMGCQRIMKLKFHKCHNRETYLILHITNHLHHSQLNHFDILKEASNQNVKCCHKCHILVKGFVSKGGAKQFATFDFIVNLNMPCWHSRSLAFRSSCTWTTSHLRSMYYQNIK